MSGAQERRASLRRAATAAAATVSERSNQENAVTQVECDGRKGGRDDPWNTLYPTTRKARRERYRVCYRQVLELPFHRAHLRATVRRIIER